MGGVAKILGKKGHFKRNIPRANYRTQLGLTTTQSIIMYF
jgi:hypothetical protein